MSAWQEYKKSLGTQKLWDVVNGKNLIALEEEYKARLNICLNCPELIKFTKQCKKCGCFMSVKTKLKESSCPLGKW